MSVLVGRSPFIVARDSVAYTRVILKQCDHCSFVLPPCPHEGCLALLYDRKSLQGHTMKGLCDIPSIQSMHIIQHMDSHQSLR